MASTGRTALYEAIKSGALRAVKRGLPDELRTWVESFPPIKAKPSERVEEPGLGRGGR